MTVIEPEPYKGRKLFTQFNIEHNNPQVQEIAQRQFASLCRAMSVDSVEDSEQLHFLAFTAKVGLGKPSKDGQYPARAEIRRYYFPDEGNVPAPEIDANQPAPQPAAANDSQQKIRIVADDVRITSKLIDGTFPDYERVIPKSNERVITVDRDALMKASDRVSTVSSERGRAVKFSIAPGSIALAVAAGEASANDEVEAEYSGEPMDIGFNAAYVRDVLNVLPAGPVKLALQDGGTPGLITSDGFEGLTLVCMPMRV